MYAIQILCGVCMKMVFIILTDGISKGKRIMPCTDWKLKVIGRQPVLLNVRYPVLVFCPS